MEDGVRVEIVGDRALRLRLKNIPEKAAANLRKTVMAEALKVEAGTKQKLSGEVLNVVTGALRASIFSEWLTDSPKRMVAHVASGGVAYAGIHEFGGIIPAHEVVAKAGGMLRFEIAGQVFYRQRVFIPDVKMPERSYLRSTFAERRPEIIEAMELAVREAIKE